MLPRLDDTARYAELTDEDCRALQREGAGRVDLRFDGRPIRHIAGADTAFRGGGDGIGERMVAAIVVVDAATLAVTATATAVGVVDVPYRPGMLSFREVPVLLEAWSRLGSVRDEVDLLMVDGHGLVHPRRFGLGCHLGVLLDVPTLGVAKSRFVGRYGACDAHAGAWAPITLDGATVGAVVRTRHGIRPVYASPGHRIDLATTVAQVVRTASAARVPEPTRQADILCERLCREA